MDGFLDLDMVLNFMYHSVKITPLLIEGKKPTYGEVVEYLPDLPICEEVDVAQRCKNVFKRWEMPLIMGTAFL